MPVNVTPLDSKLKITFSLGTDSNGKEMTQVKTYTGIKASAADEDVYSIADILTSLQSNDVIRVGRLDEKEMTQA
ncbi:DUF1659 domain-containing protein [Geosporobacter ferrireducens]|uniref:DUF1659 domain-containing protein n=1 Tax=Geosporobacter ferrireducens TaxID=1424294 RepID=A0A1D8GGK4_9FIRM|nr:DUF1659 domain-containing protein [Geosporobacter ferrireducens]AOT70038.1 hypothetical protein Gferi_10830 [Geosporobacter ferrireducens]